MAEPRRRNLQHLLVTTTPAGYDRWDDFLTGLDNTPSQTIVNILADLIVNNVELQPIEIVDNVVVDGCHRVAAHLTVGATTIAVGPVTTHTGTRVGATIDVGTTDADTHDRIFAAIRSIPIGDGRSTWLEGVDAEIDASTLTGTWNVHGPDNEHNDLTEHIRAVVDRATTSEHTLTGTNPPRQ